MASRMYFAGQSGNIGYIDTDTYSWNALPSIPSGKLIRRILVISPDDIWAGLDDPGDAVLIHYDGSSWGSEQVLYSPGGFLTNPVYSFHYVSDTEIYVVFGGNNRTFWKYNGTSWTKLYEPWSMCCVPNGGPIIWGSSNQIYCGFPLILATSLTVSYYTGTAVSSRNKDPSGDPTAGGCIKSNGDVFILTNTPKLYKMAVAPASWSGTSTDWTLVRALPGVGLGYGSVFPCLWLDPNNEDIYVMNGGKLSKYDGTSWTDDTVTRQYAVHGVTVNGNTQVWTLGQIGATTNVPSYGTIGSWTSLSGLGFDVSHMQGYTDPDSISPYIENKFPAPSSIDICVDTLISFDAVDNAGIDSYDAYVDGTLALDSSSGLFISPYNGPSSQITPTTVDGYTGFNVVIDNTNEFDYGKNISVRVVAIDFQENTTDETWSFTTIEDTTPPIAINESPGDGYDGVSRSTLIKIDIYDTQSGVDPTTIDAYVNGFSVYSGVSGFAAGYNGPSSSISSTTVDGYDGYRLIIDKETSYSSGQSISVQVNAKDNKGN